MAGSAIVAGKPSINHSVVRLMIKRNVHSLSDAHDLLSLLNDRLIELRLGVWSMLGEWPPDAPIDTGAQRC